MSHGDKYSYTDKQKRMAKHIEEGYEKRGLSVSESEKRAWATVNKQDHGGKKSGSGVGKPKDTSSSRKGGHLGGRAAASRAAAPDIVTGSPAEFSISGSQRGPGCVIRAYHKPMPFRELSGAVSSPRSNNARFAA